MSILDYESSQEQAERPRRGDVADAMGSFSAAIDASDEVIDELRKRLDPILLKQDPRLASVAKGEEGQSHSLLADELRGYMIRIQAQRHRLEGLLEMMQI